MCFWSVIKAKEWRILKSLPTHLYHFTMWVIMTSWVFSKNRYTNIVPYYAQKFELRSCQVCLGGCHKTAAAIAGIAGLVIMLLWVSCFLKLHNEVCHINVLCTSGLSWQSSCTSSLEQLSWSTAMKLLAQTLFQTKASGWSCHFWWKWVAHICWPLYSTRNCLFIKPHNDLLFPLGWVSVCSESMLQEQRWILQSLATVTLMFDVHVENTVY